MLVIGRVPEPPSDLPEPALVVPMGRLDQV
jgi:hypothetical protein